MDKLQTSRRKIAPKENTKPIIQQDFFYRSSVLHYICIISGFVMFTLVCFNTNDKLFMKFGGGVGGRLMYLRATYLFEMRVCFMLAVGLHIIETLYAVKLAIELYLTPICVIKWTIQTFILGYSSLRHLIDYKDTLNKPKSIINEPESKKES